MRASSAFLALCVLITPFASADLHSDGVCVNRIGGQNVYNAAATISACNSYMNRNTGNKQWDVCPDCTMKVVGNLNVCHSDAWHIGGDELNHYCKQQGAGSLAN
ncbi:hypothetical protein BDU57DRAFT_546691 [Ampelomyces quisqualis]|uniref:Cyanovirin-N domain-containing protein n=1 Tax=Ampelomyces quisqualis TaxID=50730 RepID=A0A6A5QTY7_AMPQU|nr:hypothetical protein BDU57DRAFT_546691 [Ampelomyces quisqualis]